MSKQNHWTGERLETSICGETMLEHLHRYAIAQQFVKGKKVLDIACGEGYGANLLAKQALQVIAVDIDAPTIEKAVIKYPVSNINFKTGSVLQIPAEDSSFDIITCFETLEHITEHDKMLAELKRVLAPGGIVLISTPEKLNYSDASGYKNPFHKKELYGNEFKELLSRYFSNRTFYTQSSVAGSLLQHESSNAPEDFYSGNYEGTRKDSSLPAMYHIAIVSDSTIPALNSSFFLHQKNIATLLQEENEALKRTVTYRTGNFFIAPFKFIRSLFRK